MYSEFRSGQCRMSDLIMEIRFLPSHYITDSQITHFRHLVCTIHPIHPIGWQFDMNIIEKSLHFTAQ